MDTALVCQKKTPKFCPVETGPYVGVTDNDPRPCFVLSQRIDRFLFLLRKSPPGRRGASWICGARGVKTDCVRSDGFSVDLSASWTPKGRSMALLLL